MNKFKAGLIKDTSIDIVNYIDDTYGIEVDLYAIMEFINIDMGFLFDVVEERNEIE